MRIPDPAVYIDAIPKAPTVRSVMGRAAARAATRFSPSR
jgi:hypothetical protein